jgi:ATP-dependent DNA helicase RecQ
LTANTIVSHIEMLVQSGEALDLRAHLPAGERVKHIEDAFSRLGYTRIAPVRELLGHDYSYEEIRLVRAFVRQQVSETTIDE